MTVLTQRGRIYKYVGRWDHHLVFAPDDGLDDQVMIYTLEEMRDLIKAGRLQPIEQSPNHYVN